MGSGGTGGAPESGQTGEGGAVAGAAEVGGMVAGGVTGMGSICVGGTASAGGAIGAGGVTSAGGAIETGGVTSTGAGGRGGPGGSLPADGGLGRGLLAYYACESTSFSYLPDLSGNGLNATLLTDSGGSPSFSFVAGKIGMGLHLLQAQSEYLSLPIQTLANATEMTIATWVYLEDSSSWQRIFDLGKDTTAYLFLTPKNGRNDKIRFAISKAGLNNEQILDGDVLMPLGVWKHIAVVLEPGKGGGILYLDGVPVGINTTMTLRPADVADLSKSYIGKSRYPDPYLGASIDDFRIYNRALSAVETMALALGQTASTD